MNLSEKLKIIQECGKGELPIKDIIFSSAYFAPGNIPYEVFSSYITNAFELQLCFQLLRQLSLVQSSDDSSFFLLDCTREELRDYISSTGNEEDVLRRIVTLVNESKPLEYHHVQSVFTRAKLYPSLLDDIDDLPGRIIFGMLRDKKYQEAYVFGTDCIQFFTENAGGGIVVLELKSFMAIALLPRIHKRDEAIAMMTDVYNDPRYVELGEGESEGGIIRKLSAIVIQSNVLGAESRLRRIVFGEKKIADAVDSAILEKWVAYSEALIRLGLLKEADTILDEVVERRKALFGDKDDGVTNAMHMKARVLMEERKFDEAMKLLNCVFERKNAAMELNTYDIQIELGRVLMHMKRYKKSIQMLKKVSKNVLRVLGVSHELNFVSRASIIDAYKLERDWKNALILSKELTAACEVLFDVDSTICYQNKLTLGDILLESGKPQEARVVFQELLEIAEKQRFAPEEDIASLRMRIFLTENINSMSIQTSLHLAAKEGALENVLSLIEDGKDINARDGTGMTPLHYASVYRQVEVAKALILRGAKFNCKTRNSSTPLQVATGGLMKSLLRTVTFFFEAANTNDRDHITSIALKEPWVLLARDAEGCTPLHWAALRGHEDGLKMSLELGCDPTVVSDKGNSPLHIAATKGHVSIAEALFRALGSAKRTILVDARTSSGGNTPLHVAAERGFLAMTKKLLAHGAIYNAKNCSEKTPLELTKDEGCKNFLTFVEGLFLDTTEGNIESVRTKLAGLEAEDIPAVARTRNEHNRTLLLEAREIKHLELTMELLMYIMREL